MASLNPGFTRNVRPDPNTATPQAQAPAPAEPPKPKGLTSQQLRDQGYAYRPETVQLRYEPAYKTAPRPVYYGQSSTGQSFSALGQTMSGTPWYTPGWVKDFSTSDFNNETGETTAGNWGTRYEGEWTPDDQWTRSFDPSYQEWYVGPGGQLRQFNPNDPSLSSYFQQGGTDEGGYMVQPEWTPWKPESSFEGIQVDWKAPIQYMAQLSGKPVDQLVDEVARAKLNFVYSKGVSGRQGSQQYALQQALQQVASSHGISDPALSTYFQNLGANADSLYRARKKLEDAQEKANMMSLVKMGLFGLTSIAGPALLGATSLGGGLTAAMGGTGSALGDAALGGLLNVGIKQGGQALGAGLIGKPDTKVDRPVFKPMPTTAGVSPNNAARPVQVGATPRPIFREDASDQRLVPGFQRRTFRG